MREGAAVSVGVDEQAVNQRISAICARLAGGDGDSSSELIAALATVEMELHLFGDERSGDVGAARESVALGDHGGAAAILKQSFELAAPEPAPTRAPRVARQAAATDPAARPLPLARSTSADQGPDPVRARGGRRNPTCRRTPARTSASYPRLALETWEATPPGLWALARVDATHHALVAYVEGDADPVAIARLVRDGQAAEIAFEVANDYEQRGIGTALAEELLADARAAGITEITALVTADNPAAISLLRRALRVLDISLHGPELWIRAAIPRRSRNRAPSLLRLPWDNSLDWTDET